MRFEGDLVLKKMQGAGKHDSGRSRGLSRGEKEAQFLLETAPAHDWLRDRVPAAQGVRTMPDGSRWLVMESLTAGLRRCALCSHSEPSICSLMLGQSCRRLTKRC